ncbi:hypothetical protein OCK72_00735 [Fusobacterium simiae]|uniref:Peptidase M48 domain-containing protein n=1 Tax=Fusobacterium simiae TaxID=855 RepID=A0ABT4DIG8_FUSSI|nr:hypothetical protein [Fusobacterium simiae]MCY7007171.1 hypothetical protein [Fusobacterium simiae]
MLPDFKILNPIELEKVEDFLKECFSSCNLYILNILKRERKEIDLKNIIFEVDLEKTNITEKDKIAEIYFSLEFFRKIEAYYTHMFDEKNKEFYKAISLQKNYDKNKANIFMNFMLEISCKFLIFHELGHVYNGHLSFLENEEYTDEDLKMLEWNADDFAATKILEMCAHPNIVTLINNLVKENIVLSLEHLGLLIFKAIAIVFCLSDIGYKERKEEKKHIPGRLRFFIVIINLIKIFDYLNYEKNKFCKCKLFNTCNNIINDIMDLCFHEEVPVNNFLNDCFDSKEWNQENNLEELNVENIKKTLKIEEKYKKESEKKLKKYTRMDAKLEIIN